MYIFYWNMSTILYIHHFSSNTAIQLSYFILEFKNNTLLTLEGLREDLLEDTTFPARLKHSTAQNSDVAAEMPANT